MTECDWLRILRPGAPCEAIRHALFDFDGTLSTIRQGWEAIMEPLMVEIICDGQPVRPELVQEVRDYIDHSTGILTIEQMEWLAEAARRHGWTRQVQTARAYKRIYNERLLAPVRARLARLRSGELRPEDLSVAGARRFVELLHAQGVAMYLVSGTDHEYVVEEATALGLAPYFGEHIYGALDDTAAHAKERIILRIMETHGLAGPELLVAGDGRVEIQRAVERGALALGVASDEEARCGWNERKVRRLASAGADFLVADFLHAGELADMLLAGKPVAQALRPEMG